MKKISLFFKVFFLSLFSNFSFAQTLDCFIIDNPSTNQFFVYVVARDGSFTSQQWNDMVVTFSIPISNPNNLGTQNTSGTVININLPTNSTAGGNTFQLNGARIRKQPTNVGNAPSFTSATRKYYAYAFAGLTESLTLDYDNESPPQGYYLPENTPVLIGIIPDNGVPFADIVIHPRLALETDPTVISGNGTFYIEIDNLDKSGNVYKEDIIHFNNKLNQIPVTPEPLVWRGGTDATREPNLTDGSRKLTIYNGPAVKTMIGAVDNTTFLDNTKIIINPDAGFQTSTITASAAAGEDSVIVLADATGYGQYIGPSIAGRIQQYVGTDAGWRNVAFPVNPADATAVGLNLGGAPINFNTASTSYHATSSNRDACGGFGNWINTVNMYTFTGATGSPQPHEWYGADENSVGGTLGYSVFLGNSFFPTSGTLEVKGQFNAGAQTYAYAHATPHALDVNGASQALYVNGAGCTGAPEQGLDRKNNWDGWALVANPYPSGLDVNAFAIANSISPNDVRVWNRGKAFNIVGGGGIDYQYESMAGRIVPPMQAFFVKVDGNGDSRTLNFTDAQRAFSAESFLKTSGPEVKLTAMNLADSSINHAILGFDAAATDGYDVGFDSYVLSQPRNTTPQVGFHYEYTTNGQTVVAPLYVNTVNENQPSGSYPLRFWSRSNGNFNFSLDQSLLGPGWKVYIEDLKVAPGVSVDITNQAYAFSYNTSDDVKRFILHYVNTTIGTDAFAQGGWNATGWFNTDQQMEINFNGSLLPEYVSVTITDLAGKLLFESNRVSTQENLVLANRLAAGLYLVNIQHDAHGTRLLKVLKNK